MSMKTFYDVLFFHRTDVDAVVDEIARKEPLITSSKAEQVRKLVLRILYHVYLCSGFGFFLYIHGTCFLSLIKFNNCLVLLFTFRLTKCI